MKKIVSILLALTMIFSLSAISFAAENTVVLGEKNTVTVCDEAVTYSFVPSESGVYKIAVELNSDEETAVSTYVSLGENALTSVYLYKESPALDEYSKLQGNEYFPVKAGSEVTIEVYKREFLAEDGVEVQVSFTVSRADDIREIAVGNSYDITDEYEYFSFCPTNDAIVNIWSYDDAYAYVDDSEGGIQSSKYYYQDIGLDFSFKVKAGEIYTVVVGANYFWDDESKPITIHVTDGSKIVPDSIEIDDILLIKGDSIWADVYVLPFGSNCNYETLIIEPADKSIVSCEFIEEFDQIYVTGLKAGKTTVKVTVPGYNASTEFEVEVLSGVSAFFRIIAQAFVQFFALFNDFFIGLINRF